MAAIVDELRRIPMSQRLAATLTRASDYAEAQSHAEVALEHLLLALTEDPDAGQVLAASHIDMALLKADVSQYLGGLSIRGDVGGGGALSISADLRRILEAAAAAASQGRRRDINGAIVLAAIVGDGKSSAAHMLRAQGLTFEEAIKALQRAMAAAPTPAPAPAPAPTPTPQSQPADGPSSAASPPPSPAPPKASLGPTSSGPTSRPAPDLPPFAPRTSRTAAVERTEPQPDEGWIGEPDVETAERAAAPPSPSPPVPPASVSPDPAPPRRSETPTLEDFRQAVTAELEAAKRANYDDPPSGGRATEPPDSFEPARPAGPVTNPLTSPASSTAFDPFNGQPYTPGSLPRAAEAPSQSSPPPALPPLAPSPRLTLEPLPPRRPAEPRARRQMPQPGGRWPDPVGPAWERPPFEQQPVGAAPTLPPPPLPAFDDFGAISPASGMPASASRGPDQPGGFGGSTDARSRDRSYDEAAPNAQAAPWPDATLSPSSPLGPSPAPGAGQGASTGTMSPQLPPLPSFGSPERPPELAPAAATYERDVPSFDLPTLPPREPTQGRAAGRLPGADASGRRRRVPIDNAVAGQLVENIPRRMRAHVPSTVEVRLGMGEARTMLEGLDGEAMVHSVITAPAMSVRLRGPKGAFLIEPLSPETQWLDGRVGPIDISHAAWRWNVTPLTAGRRRLQLVISARTGRADGTFADTAVPDQVVDVSVATNYGRATAKLLTWTTLAIAGGIIGRFGEQAYEPIVETITRLIR
jgi:hypothetical protein